MRQKESPVGDSVIVSSGEHQKMKEAIEDMERSAKRNSKENTLLSAQSHKTRAAVVKLNNAIDIFFLVLRENEPANPIQNSRAIGDTAVRQTREKKD